MAQEATAPEEREAVPEESVWEDEGRDLPALPFEELGLRQILDSLTASELEWVMIRADCRSDAEAARKLGREKHNPFPDYTEDKSPDGIQKPQYYPKERLSELRKVATLVRRERVMAVNLTMQRALGIATSRLIDLITSERTPAKVRLDAIRELFDRTLGKPYVKDAGSGSIEAVTELVLALRGSLPSAAEVEAKHRGEANDYIEGNYLVAGDEAGEG